MLTRLARLQQLPWRRQCGTQRAGGLLFVLVATWCMAAAGSPVVRIESPSKTINLAVLTDRGRLGYHVTFRDRPVIQTSDLGITVDRSDLGQGTAIGKVVRQSENGKYAWRGVHSEATNSFHGAKVEIRHVASDRTYFVEARAFNDGVAFRYIVPGLDHDRRVPDAATTFKIPPRTILWYHALGDHYEGVHTRKEIEKIPAGDWVAPPLTIKLPESSAYAAITEANLRNYPGMVLRADGENRFREVLAHDAPVGYPFTLRFGDTEAKRLAVPAAIEGTITSPWRVVMIGANLNTLVNSDIVHNLSQPPDKRLFPEGIKTSWIRPGRAVWRYLDGGENTFEGIKEFSKLAGELGFEYNLVEGIWQKWSEDQLRELVDYSAERKVGIWVWRHNRTLRQPEERRQLFAYLRKVGVVGVKVDFLDHEAKELIDLYQAILKDAAEHQLMINFHGANKPAGEPRTWPNEMTREGIYGLEHRRMEAWGEFNTIWPFTRMLAGHADYTPMVFGERRRETSWAHQIATAVVVTSPLLVFGAHPANVLSNPALYVIRSIPSVWDQTIVLPVSEIGEVAAFARRNRNDWFLAILNGPRARTVRVPLSFLGRGKYITMLVRDQTNEAVAVDIEHGSATRQETLEIVLRPGGGFVGRFYRPLM